MEFAKNGTKLLHAHLQYVFNILTKYYEAIGVCFHNVCTVNIHFIYTMLQMGLTVLPAKSDRDVMFCLQSYQGLRIKGLLVYLSYPQDRINTQVIY